MTLRVATAWSGIDRLNPPAIELQNLEAGSTWLKILALSLVHAISPLGAALIPLRLEDLEWIEVYPGQGLCLSFALREEWIEWARFEHVLLDYAPLPWAVGRYVITFECVGHSPFELATDTESADGLFQVLRDHCGAEACSAEFSSRGVTLPGLLS